VASIGAQTRTGQHEPHFVEVRWVPGARAPGSCLSPRTFSPRGRRWLHADSACDRFCLCLDIERSSVPYLQTTTPPRQQKNMKVVAKLPNAPTIDTITATAG